VRASSDRSAASAGNDQYQADNERNDAQRPDDGDTGQKADDQQYYPEDNHLSSLSFRRVRVSGHSRSRLVMGLDVDLAEVLPISAGIGLSAS